MKRDGSSDKDILGPLIENRVNEPSSTVESRANQPGFVVF
jgi:hypothetical protein